MNEKPSTRALRTIGVLSGWPIYGSSGLNPFSELLLEGIKDAAGLHKCNLLISGGDNPVEAVDFWPPWNHPLPKAEYLPIGPGNTDGLIMTLPCSDRMKSHISQMKETGHPVITWGLGVGGPCVLADNEAGIRMALDHLYEHGHRKIAFIAGFLTDTGDSLSRIEAYKAWMAEKELPLDPRQIVFGLHHEQGGQRALNQLWDSGVEFTAVLASNDQSAIGAMRAIEKAGRRVPEDIAVIGFDNQAETLAQIPPLTTVGNSLYQAGFRLLELLLAQIEGDLIPDATPLPVELVIRQSCGCLPQATKPIDSRRTRALGLNSCDDQEGESNLWCERLMEPFYRSLQEGNGEPFRRALQGILKSIVMLDRELDGLHEVVSVLRATVPKDVESPFAEDLFHQARVMICEGAKGRYHRNLLLEKRNARALEELSTHLFATLNETQVLQVFQESLDSVRIRHAQVVFFETGKNDEDPVAWGVIKRPGEEPPELRFPSKRFPPSGLYPEGKPFHLVLLPLISGEDDMGFIAFDADNLSPCGVISRATAAAIRSARLYARVHELSLTDPLTGLCNRRSLMDLLTKEVERSLRNKSPFAVVMLDIDHFKSYNDTYGHPAGDDALRRVAGFVRQVARRSIDVAARYGGEEFLILLPECNLQGAWMVAETIRTLVEACGDLERKTTVSLGISLFQENESSAQECIDRADKALYAAKESSRNCTRIFGM